MMDKRLTVRVDSELAAAVDRFIADNVIPATSKQDAVRHIMRDWLSAKGYLGDAQRVDGIHLTSRQTPKKSLILKWCQLQIRRSVPRLRAVRNCGKRPTGFVGMAAPHPPSSRTVDAVKRGEDLPHIVGGEAVIDLLSLAPRLDEVPRP